MGRFAYLVDFAEGIESFRAQYRIPPRVSIRYCKEGEWHEDRQEVRGGNPNDCLYRKRDENSYGHDY